ncbi:nascent polypeptide-associated complex protein [Thermoplasmatales archaeon ex4572_165]|nr:MAG: nascent polypeptide-associated complex protein [Thermoplasmatales archaeon ex4572_165]RLF59987.1 MAG: nascent polypeptide-associated complex protein [Thermoplasmata archaeon]
MLPRGMNPKQMNQMMRKLGINVKDVKNVEKVIIQTDTKEYVFSDAEVTIMNAQGQKTFQIVGNPVINSRKEEIPNDDINLIVDQTGKTFEEAKEALEKTQGDIAEAILLLTQQ